MDGLKDGWMKYLGVHGSHGLGENLLGSGGGGDGGGGGEGVFEG